MPYVFWGFHCRSGGRHSPIHGQRESDPRRKVMRAKVFGKWPPAARSAAGALKVSTRIAARYLTVTVNTNEVPEVSAVIPCLNEANSLAICIGKALRAFESAGLAGEVVVADNGSTDGSREIARASGARVVEVRERGYGA